MKVPKLFLLIISFGALPLASVHADHYPQNPDLDILHYRFELTLSDDTDEIQGVTTIRFLFRKNGLDKIRLDLVNQSPGLNGKGMKIESIYQGDKSVSFTHQDNEVWITLSSPSVAGAEREITLRYHGIPADGLRIGATKFGDRSFFNENWPNRARHWLPTVDHPYEKATSEFIVKAPSHYQVVSNGLLVEETSLDLKTKLTHWKQSVPVSSWLYVLGVAEFAVQYVDSFEGKSVQTWVYRQDRDVGFYDFAEPTRQVVDFFSDYIGPYVYEKIANVETPSVHGGMETSSAIFYGEDLIDGKRTTRLRNIVIHELAHQWFGNSVTETTWDDAWLSEGFATYFTMLFIEHAYGRDELLSQLAASKTMVSNYTAKDSTYMIIDNRSPENGSVTNVLTYQKGAWFLHMLRNRIGDKSFQQGIRDYYKQFTNANSSTADFKEYMERASGQDLGTFFRQWLQQGGIPSLRGSWSYDRAHKQIHISLQSKPRKEFTWDVSVEVGIYFPGKILPEISEHRVAGNSIEFTLPAEVRPEKIVLDPRSVLLASLEFRENH